MQMFERVHVCRNMFDGKQKSNKHFKGPPSLKHARIQDANPRYIGNTFMSARLAESSYSNAGGTQRSV